MPLVEKTKEQVSKEANKNRILQQLNENRAKAAAEVAGIAEAAEQDIAEAEEVEMDDDFSEVPGPAPKIAFADKEPAPKIAFVDKEPYVVADDETDVVHVKLSQGRLFDEQTGKKIGLEYIQKFEPNEFKVFEAHAVTLGYRFEILHKPN